MSNHDLPDKGQVASDPPFIDWVESCPVFLVEECKFLVKIGLWIRICWSFVSEFPFLYLNADVGGTFDCFCQWMFLIESIMATN